MNESIICPSCNGEKQFFVYAGSSDRIEPHPCFTCRGEHTITTEHHKRIEAGKKLRADRVARRMSLRAEAARLSTTATELSRLEQGRGSKNRN